MTRVYIDRNRWLRGEGPGSSRLLRSTDMKMCCLGFASLALGKTEEDIMNVNCPAGDERIGFDGRPSTRCPRPGNDTPLVKVWEGQWPEVGHPDQVAVAMRVNDEEDTSDSFKEMRLTELLGELGLELVFGDGPEVGP